MTSQRVTAAAHPCGSEPAQPITPGEIGEFQQERRTRARRTGVKRTGPFRGHVLRLHRPRARPDAVFPLVILNPQCVVVFCPRGPGRKPNPRVVATRTQPRCQNATDGRFRENSNTMPLAPTHRFLP